MSRARKAQLSEILNWVKNLEQKDPSNLIIFGGDFNTGPSESYYAGEFVVLTNSVFHFKLVPSSWVSFTWFEKKSGLRELIDHFFVTSGSSVLSRAARAQIFSQTTAAELSDHNLVVMSLN